MADEPTLGGVPFEEAIEHFRGKLDLPTPYWDAIKGEAHAKAFTVAGAMKRDLLKDLRKTVDKVLAEGGTIADFRAGFDAAVAEHGWSYKGTRGWRTRIIYDTNLRTAHAAGKWKQFQRVKARRPWLQYQTAGDARVRAEHVAWDGLVLHIDDPWWNTHYPPNGWGCRCIVRSLSQRQLDRLGSRPGTAPPLNPTERINTRTGEIYGEVPEGIDTGWNYNVGQAWLRTDTRGLLPDGLDAPEFARRDGGCIRILPGQKTWKDYERPDLRHVPQELRPAAPDILPPSANTEEALAVLTGALGLSADKPIRTVETAIKETAVFHVDYLGHLVEKRQDARERYANFIIPTLINPFEVYATEYSDGIRSRYIGIYKGKRDLLVVVRRGQDGHMLWNIMQAKDKDMNSARVGELILKK